MTLERSETGFNPESEIKINGNVLWLTKNSEIVRQQIEGKARFSFVPEDQLASNVSTDEIIPSRHCFNYTPQNLSQYCLTGFRGDVIKPGEIKNAGFDLVISGPSLGSGSSREHAPIALKGAGVKFVAANPIERIFKKNSQNIGLQTMANPDNYNKLAANWKIRKEALVFDLDPITKDLAEYGGLLPYLKARLDGKINLPIIETDPRPMTLAEKIIAAHWVNPDGSIGRIAVKPADTGFIKADFQYGYELSTPLGYQGLLETFGENFEVKNRDQIVLFADHTALLEAKTPKQANDVANLHKIQREFARKFGIKLYPASEGICHNVVVDKHALPGQVILGTDSHTCSVGVVGAFANGIGATEMAGSWLTGDVSITVPPSWKFNLFGSLPNDVTTKDVMLQILSHPKIKAGQAVGKIFEFAPIGRINNFDELFVLTNMAVEGGAFSGIVEPGGVVKSYLNKQRGIILQLTDLESDPNAQYEEVFDIDLSNIAQMVATPGDPRNGRELSEVVGIKTDAVYIGSCTGGKLSDLIAVANVLYGRKVRIPTFIQASSGNVRKQADSMGLLKIFQDANAQIIDSGCGDCCNLGFGIASDGQTVVSDTNRNFPGRMGKNNVYLVNPKVAAMAAVKGELVLTI